MRWRDVVFVGLTALYARCTDDRTTLSSLCPEQFSGEFAAEQEALCSGTVKAYSFTDESSIGDICDAVEEIQDAIANSFLDHHWVIGKGKNIYDPDYFAYEEVSPLFFPQADVGKIQGMQCYRNVIHDKDKPGNKYVCALQNGGNLFVPDVAFSITSQLFSPTYEYPLEVKMKYLYYENERYRANIETSMGPYGIIGSAESPLIVSVEDDRSGLNSQELCYKLDHRDFEGRSTELIRFVDNMIQQ